MNHYKKILFITGATVSLLCVCGCAVMNKPLPQKEKASTTSVPNKLTLEYRQ